MSCDWGPEAGKTKQYWSAWVRKIEPWNLLSGVGASTKCSICGFDPEHCWGELFEHWTEEHPAELALRTMSLR